MQIQEIKSFYIYSKLFFYKIKLGSLFIFISIGINGLKFKRTLRNNVVHEK